MLFSSRAGRNREVVHNQNFRDSRLDRRLSSLRQWSSGRWRAACDQTSRVQDDENAPPPGENAPPEMLPVAGQAIPSSLIIRVSLSGTHPPIPRNAGPPISTPSQAGGLRRATARHPRFSASGPTRTTGPVARRDSPSAFLPARLQPLQRNVVKSFNSVGGYAEGLSSARKQQQMAGRYRQRDADKRKEAPGVSFALRFTSPWRRCTAS